MQTVGAIIVVVAAGVYLGWQFYKRFISKKSKCDGCAISQTKS